MKRRLRALKFNLLIFVIIFAGFNPNVVASGSTPVPDTITTLSYSDLPTSPITDVAYGNGVYIAVGYNGAIIKSSDAETWTNVKTRADVSTYTGLSGPVLNGSTTFVFTSVAFGNGIFVASGTDGVILTSPDGVEWTQQFPGITSRIADIEYLTFNEDSAFYATTVGKFLKSSDGIEWTPITPTGLAANSTITEITVGNDGTRLAVGADTGYIFSTTDGFTWTSAQPAANDAGDIYRANGTNILKWVNDRYIISDISAWIWTSTDLNTFTQIGAPFKQEYLERGVQMFNVIYDGSKYYMFGYQSPYGYGAVYTSTNGSTWELQEFTNSFVGQKSAYVGGKYFRVGNEGMLVSSDGINWNYKWGGNYSDVIYDGTKYIAVGRNGNDGFVWTSTDLQNWIRGTVSSYTSLLYASAYGNNKYVAVGEAFNNNMTIVISDDGISWTKPSAIGGSTSLYDIAFGLGKFVVVGGNSSSPAILYSTDNGVTWNNATNPSHTGGTLTSITYIDNQFIALGYDDNYERLIWFSNDGMTWSDISSTYPESYDAVINIIYDGNDYILLGYDAVSYNLFTSTSSDLLNWSTKSVIDNSYSTYSYGNQIGSIGSNLYVIGTNDLGEYIVFYSNDQGQNWQEASTGISPEILESVIMVNNKLLITGNGQLVMTTNNVVTEDAHTVTSSANTLTPVAGATNAITFTVKDSLGNTDTNFTGSKQVTITGVEVAPDGTYGSFNNIALTAAAESTGQVITVSFTNGVATVNLVLHNVDAQTIGLSVADVTSPSAGSLTLTPTAGAATSMSLSGGQDITAPTANGGLYAQQPRIILKDAYGNTSVSDNSTVITVSKKDTGAWTLTGTTTATAVAGVVTFTNLGATNNAEVIGAQLAFNGGSFTELTSATVTLPAPAGAQTVTSSANTLTPVAGATNAITFTVKDSLGNTDTNFTGSKQVTITGVEVAPDGTYGSFNNIALTAAAAGAGQVITVSFTNGVATVNLSLNKADAQTIGLSVADVTSPSAGSLTLTPTAGAATSMSLSGGQDITAPTANGGLFTQQPRIILKDAYGNTSVSDNSTVITVSKKDTGAWTLTGITTATAVAGIVTFTNLGATNNAEVTGAQLAFNGGSFAELTSATVTLPAPAGAQTVTSSANTLTPVAGATNAITFTVKDSLGNTDTNFTGTKQVTITGAEVAPDGTYGSFNDIALTAAAAGAGQVITVSFTNGVATVNLSLNKADAQTIGLSVADVTSPSAGSLTLTPTAGAATSMSLSGGQDITAPTANGGLFAQQPRIILKDAYGNTSVSDNSTVITVSKKDTGAWTLTGTTTATAVAGVVTFTNLGATNNAEVIGAQLAFNGGSFTELTSATVTLPAPAGAQTVTSSANTLTPVAGATNAITFTVKDSLGNTDTNFTGTKQVTITGVEVAPDGTYGSFNDIALTAAAAGAGQVITVSFTNGVATVNLSLNKADAQTIGLSVADVTSPSAGSLTLTPTAGAATSMSLSGGQDITAPTANGGLFTQQPRIILKDAYGNTSVSDNSTVITVSKKDTGAWTLTGITTATAVAGIVTFTNLGATNNAEVTGAQLAFNGGSFAELTSATVTLPAPAGAQTVTSSANTLTPVAGATNAITFTVKDSLGNTDTNFTGTKQVTITGAEVAPDGTYGSFNDIALTAAAAGAGQVITVSFTNGVATVNLSLNKADAQTIGLSVADVTSPSAGSLTLTPTAGAATSMSLSGGQDITAPTANGGLYAQQPRIILKDAYGNTSVSDNSTVITVSKKDTGAWTLTGTTTATAVAGVVTFTNLGATNNAEVIGAQLAFNGGSFTELTSATVTLPAPAGAQTVTSSANTLTPVAGATNAITFTVKDSLGNTDTNFTGSKQVTITGVEVAPDGTYGSFNNIALTAAAESTGQVITVSFTNGVATVNLVLHNVDAQTIGLSVADVTSPSAGSLTLTPTAGTATSMSLSGGQDITAPTANGGLFAQQPRIILKDAYGNTSVSDNSTVITVSKKDAGAWTLTGTTTATAVAGVVTFTNLGATNNAEVIGAQLAFNGGSFAELTSATVTLPAPPPAPPAPPVTSPSPISTNIEIVVNGKIENSATGFITKEDNKTITTVALDDKKIDEKLQAEGNNSIVMIPVLNNSDVVVGQLNGQTVKNMENKEAVLVIKTDNATYTLPASQINIDNVSLQFGQQVDLQDIKVNVSISTPTQDTINIVENTANKNNYQLVVPPIEFTITSTSGGKTVEISKFNGYVERMLAIPDGIDPSKITTGIVLNPDGTFFHVPTQIQRIDGKYYAIINSLTNSTYSVIWSPKEFNDVSNHWAKDAVNNLGSRLVVNGITEDTFNPNNDITRAEFAAFIVRGLGLKPGMGKNIYSDVPEDAWYTEYIKTATEYNLISGYDNGQFGPNDKITRQQAIAIIARAMALTNLALDLQETHVNKILSNYSDSNQIAEYAKEYVAITVNTGVLNGRSNQSIAPKDHITRAEVAVIIERLLKKAQLIN